MTYLLLTMMVSLATAQYMTFDEFITKFHKQYQSGTQQYNTKQLIYEQNIEILKEKDCSVCGVTTFFDQKPQQFESRTLTLIMSDNQTSDKFPDEAKEVYKVGAPSSIDWRRNGVITSIKRQGECGSCWAFTSVAMAESSLILKGLADKDVDLSEQFLLECTPNSDCQGGLLENAIDKVIASGLPVESRYPYDPDHRHQGICSTLFNTKISKKPRRSFYGLQDEEIKDLLTLGPVAVAVSSTDWQYYASGIWKCRPTDPINHAVLLIGYTSNAWIIKNQWGDDWGENGYIYVSMNSRYNCKINAAVHLLKQHNLQYYLLCLLIFYVLL